MNTKHNGFTIVELLVVIVVIAILAAITLVSYNGIRNRAYNTAIIQSASSAQKIIDIAYASQGTITVSSGLPDGNDGEAVGFCIGDPNDFPADSHFGSGECHTNNGYRGFWASAELWNVLSQYGSGDMSTPTQKFGPGYIRGVTYTWQPSKSTGEYSEYLHYNMVGEGQDCQLPGSEDVSDIGNGFQDDENETSCWVNMTKRYNGAEVISW